MSKYTFQSLAVLGKPSIKCNAAGSRVGQEGKYISMLYARGKTKNGKQKQQQWVEVAVC